MMFEDKFIHNIEDSHCPICLCDYNYGDLIVRNSCGHFMHESCARSYYQRECKEIPKCPYCRHNPLEKKDGVKCLEIVKIQYEMKCLKQQLEKINKTK